MYKLITYPGTPHLPPPGDLLKPFWELVFFFFFKGMNHSSPGPAVNLFLLKAPMF